MIKHADGFDESSILVPSSSSLLKGVEQFGYSMDGLILLEQYSSTLYVQNPYLR